MYNSYSNKKSLMKSIKELEKKHTLLEEECVSLRKQVSKLSKIKDDFNSFLENTSDFIYIKDIKHRFTSVSSAFAELTNHKSRHDIVGKTDFDIFPEEDARTYFKEQKKVIEKGIELIGIEEPYHDKEGKLCWVSTSKRPLYNSKREIIGLIGISRDITKTKILEEKLRKKAHYDDLTGLSTRNYFFQKSALILSLAARMNYTVGLFFIDLNKFKPVNDTYGHESGDYVLHVVAKRLNGILRDSDLISRFGGDEFVMLAVVESEQSLNDIALKILTNVCMPITFKNQEIKIGCSIGISHFPIQSKAIEELVRKADEAMYKAKVTGKSTYHMFSNK